MADIALMVAEEFEERVQRGAPDADGGESLPGRNFAAVEKVLSSWVESAATAASGVSVNFAVRIRDLEPKTGLGLAALDGFFSA